ncbi:hypothetical protein CBS101457_006146 [Exobasidium rhododendri]|nr:hypothetical protein CBS101457_006146 [Exobasidium rhododendri]
MSLHVSQIPKALVVVFAGILCAIIYRHQCATLPPETWQTRSNGTHEWARTVLLISLDGLKPDYLASGHLPVLSSLSRGNRPHSLQHSPGILSTKALIPVSPSLTFPNHWSIQTGLQPSSHGIVANDFHIDADRSFYYTDPSRSWKAEWWRGISIWEQLEAIGVKSANLMWPGPPTTSNNISSTYFQKYVKGWSLEERLDKILYWLDKEVEERPRFVCGYVPNVDTVTHDLGPDTTNGKVQATLQEVDRFILELLQNLEARNATSIVNVVIVSDHGMTSTSNDQLLYLEDLLGDTLHSQLQFWDGWPNVGLRFSNESLLVEASTILKKAKDVPYEVVNRKELIETWKWEMTEAVAERMANLWILPDAGWSVTTKEEMLFKEQNYTPKGNHGYDARNADMSAFFLALGPSIRPSTHSELPPFSNLEIHNLVMDMLLIPKADRVPNNGTTGFWDGYISASQ